jgi:hypothetical protein
MTPTQDPSLSQFNPLHTFFTFCFSKIVLTFPAYLYIRLLLLFISSDTSAQRGLWPPRSRGFLITHNDAPQSVGILWTSDQSVAETSTWQHTQQKNIHSHGGIRTHDRSRRAAADLESLDRAATGTGTYGSRAVVSANNILYVLLISSYMVHVFLILTWTF